MSLLTTWGYTLTGDSAALADIITEQEFNAFTAGKYSGDGRISSAIKAASMSVREYCGWHVCGSMDCSFSDHILHQNGRIKNNGADLVIQLPAKYVSAVASVVIGDNTLSASDYVVDASGILHVFDVYYVDRKTNITVNYTAGLTDAMSGSVKEIVANMVSHALSSSYGVQSEAAGGVSVTYSASWSRSGAASAITDDAKDILVPYRLQGVF
jgi:hypothetical protein